ncbi:ABC transporter substrate-binding protein [Marinobacterium aestuarii]|uniref:ABC transporter substrate-binding protein n=1 Tax=Marinobacterium aestuarii TaxID=1821621 RepID=A0A1A9F124_9GAMM|nr:ABC transporter substrate-binding protein [Marinobacterium aestuarii]ANG63857.1 ABC transporter substrate-binding protein [Marinobacterium aestuarii]
MKKSLAAVALMLAASTGFAAEDCGKVTIADMNWSSATLIANIDRFILEHGFGCAAELVPGDTMPTTTSMMEKREPDIAPELWTNSFQAALDKAVAEGQLQVAGKVLSEGGEEALWVPKYMVDKDPSLATIEGVKANAKLFIHPEDPDRSALIGCPAGWGCQLVVNNLYRALKLEDAGFELIDPGSAAGLDGSIARAYEREEAWLGYYWAPTAILGKYDMVKVDFGSGVDKEHFLSCTTKEDCLEPKVTMWPESPVYSYTTSDFAKSHPKEFEYLATRSFSNGDLNKLLAWMEDNQADGEIAMEHYLMENESSWSAWLEPEVAAKVKDALGKL